MCKATSTGTYFQPRKITPAAINNDKAHFASVGILFSRSAPPGHTGILRLQKFTIEETNALKINN
jgi:hypothetical protein